ncbi:meiosis-specific with OB domain-containing protein-like [Tubulanus polymorphus]|uniref:meiosis-specific with OB domain-containing protein-like n=1 Tax=Tubulanus polymorphus TaxID=672921 RepID=UPI003DA61578
MAWNDNNQFRQSDFDFGSAHYQQTSAIPNYSTGITSIKDLVPGISNTVIVGVVLAKEQPKAIPSKKVPGSELHLLSFTIRDSPDDSINATCWGGYERIRSLAELFHINDIVEIGNPQVQSKPSDGRDEKFRPTTHSCFCLNISEHHSTLKLYAGVDLNPYTQLLHVPIRPGSDYQTLGDVLANGQVMIAGGAGDLVNILAAVRNVGDAKEVNCKNGRVVKKCEVQLMDETCASASLTLWDNELSNMAQTWIPKEHVLFLVDIKASFDSYRKKVALSTCSKSVIITNPDTQEAYNLYQFAQSVEISTDPAQIGCNNFMAEDSVDLSSIKDVYNVQQLKQIFIKPEFSATGYTYGIIYGYLSKFDLDATDSACVFARCGSCNRVMDIYERVCENIDCPNFSAISHGDQCPVPTRLYYSIYANISDLTGTLTGCLLQASVAEKAIGFPPEQFIQAPVSMKTHIKWKYLLEKCKIYVKVFLPSFDRPKPSIRILSMSLVNLQESLRFMRL